MTSSAAADRAPVIVGVGEIVDRPARPQDGREPAALMVDALRLAEADAGVGLLGAIDHLDIINEISWPYADPCAVVRARLGRPELSAAYRPIGGQTPVLALHEAALRVQRGENVAVAICGAEAQQTVLRALKDGVELPWSPSDPEARPIRGGDHQSQVAKALDLATPAHVYPFYEASTRAAWRQTFAEAQAESGAIWAENARVATSREAAWIRRDVRPEEITEPGPENRLIAWPYTKLMVANPMVNQGGALIVTSLAKARELGCRDDRLVHIWGGSAADEPRDFLKRDSYARSLAMDRCLEDAQALVEGRRFDALELYSCFPCVPKMARRRLGVSQTAQMTMAGGLTFFGAPLNNYMTHAAVAMVQALRGRPSALGLLYGQGEYVTKHHVLVLGGGPAPKGPLDDYRHIDVENDLGAKGPILNQGYVGPARIETSTVLFDRSGEVRHGGVIARTPAGERLLARTPAEDREAIERLLGADGREPVSAGGVIRRAADGVPEWTLR